MATEADFQRLTGNDDRLTTLILTFDYTLNVEQLQQALSRNLVVSEIVVYIDETFLPGRNVLQLQRFFATLGSMRSLQKLCFNSRSGFQGLLSMDACLIPVLSHATQLVSFAISDLKLTGGLADWARFAEQLQRLFFLKSFCIMECELLVTTPADGIAYNGEQDEQVNANEMGETDEPVHREFLNVAHVAAPPHRPARGAAMMEAAADAVIPVARPQVPDQDEDWMDDILVQQQPRRTYPLDPVLMVLSILPSLEIIYLHSTAGQGLGDVSVRAVGALCLSASVRVLKLRDFDFTQEHLTTMALMLEVNPRLKDLKIGTLTQFDPTAARAMGKLLQTNATLECLELGLSHMITDECASIVAYALQRNKGLKTFALAKDGAHRNQLNGINPVAAVNDDGKISEHCHQAFVDALSGNYHLENFVLFQRFPVKPEIKLYVTLNKFGRGKLLQNESKASAGEWIKAIARVSDDLEAVYYYISTNPELCGEALVPSASPPAGARASMASIAAYPPAYHAPTEFLRHVLGLPFIAAAAATASSQSMMPMGATAMNNSNNDDNNNNRRKVAEPSGRYDHEPATPGVNKRRRCGP